MIGIPWINTVIAGLIDVPKQCFYCMIKTASRNTKIINTKNIELSDRDADTDEESINAFFMQAYI